MLDKQSCSTYTFNWRRNVVIVSTDLTVQRVGAALVTMLVFTLGIKCKSEKKTEMGRFSCSNNQCIQLRWLFIGRCLV